MDRRISTSAEYVEDAGEVATRCPVILMLRIGATQYYHDPLKAGINDVQELSKSMRPSPRRRPIQQSNIGS